MLYHLFVNYAQQYHVLNVFKYITFRTGGALLTGLLVGLFFAPSIIKWLKSQQGKGQPIRQHGPESHLLTKVGTPTMGGVIILLGTLLSSLLWCNLENPYIWIVLFVTLALGIVGGIDDWMKIKKQHADAMSAKMKASLQIIISLMAVFAVQSFLPEAYTTTLAVPFFKNVLIDLGIFYIPFGIIVIIGASNAVNLTDGLDGLAIGPVIIASLCFALIAYLVGHHNFAHYLQLHSIPNSGELSIICGGLIGSGLGFLWYNAPPARIFMGDTGSLSIGGALGTISVITKHEIVLAIIGGLFVMEALSVIIQVGYFKWTKGKRIFLMAPLHHHFEKKGWSEPTIVIRFWIIAIIMALLGLSTLKLR
jgi:phospho-N-acetylmuramoyl-pentapeptide-transferase